MKHLLPAVQRTALRIPWAAVGGCAAALLLTAAAPGGQLFIYMAVSLQLCKGCCQIFCRIFLLYQMNQIIFY